MIDLAPALREMLAAHELFRTCHFAPEEIFVAFANPKPPHAIDVLAVVQRSGLRYVYNAGTFAGTQDQCIQAWAAAAEWWNAKATNDERMEIFMQSRIRMNAVDVLMDLIGVGFSLKESH